MDVLESLIVAILPLVLVCFCYKKQIMTGGGSVTAFVLSVIIGYSTSVWWMLAFILFPVIGFLATFWKIDKKREMGVQEGKHGERSMRNILGVGTIPTAIALVYCMTDAAHFELMVAFISALAVSTSDTVASEIGVNDPKVWMITTFKRVEPGVNGGISRLGTLVSLVSAMIFAYLAWGIVNHDLLDIRFVIPAMAGLFGNLADSFLGAVLENPGYISKYTNNASTSLIGGIAGFLVAMFF
ncbi:MAG: DUF92 domain-containing protein [archaeon]|nr:DUF92 domain-containing protein [archaeon]